MFTKKTFSILNNILKNKTQCYHTTKVLNEQSENPIWRTLRILKDDVTITKRILLNQRPDDIFQNKEFPRHVDVLVIGGGAIGSSVAYWLKQRTQRDGLSVAVVEKDPTYMKCSTSLSLGGLRQQFSLPENIRMSLYGAEFLRKLKKRFGNDAEVNFHPNGYLILASEEGADILRENHILQRELGAINCLLSKNQLKERYPWLDVHDIELGCLGLEKEGWFDPHSLLSILKKGALNEGAAYVKAEVVDFEISDIEPEVLVEGVSPATRKATQAVVVKLPNGELRTIEFSCCIIAAGCESGDVARLLNIGKGPDILTIPLPVERRKRYVFSFDCKETLPGLNIPMIFDTTGAYFRREGLGGKFIGGISPSEDQEPPTNNLEVDYSFFDQALWPILARRVPAFNAVKVTGGWSGYYEYNTFDQNGIIGPHPYYYNIYIATGFSGHGIQQAPAVGRAISELILDGEFKTIDLSRLGFDRILLDKPMYEVGIY